MRPRADVGRASPVRRSPRGLAADALGCALALIWGFEQALCAWVSVMGS